MWKIKFTVRKLMGKGTMKKTIVIGTIMVMGSYSWNKTYFYVLWINTPKGRVYEPIPIKSFDKNKYKGDERLCKFILKYLSGEGDYSIIQFRKKGKGMKSAFYGTITNSYFIRYKRDGLTETGMAPYLSTTMPIGAKHTYQ